MKKFKTQIILVSGQMIPNVTPVMDVEIRPENVILCTSNKMKKHAEILQNYFAERKITSEVYPLGNAFEFSELKEKFLELASRCEAERENIGVNLTGGTKLMTIAATISFADNGFACFYVVPEKDTITMITPSQCPDYEIREQMKLEDFFAIHGFRVNHIRRNINVSDASRKLFDSLLQGYDLYVGALGTLNGLAAEAEYKNVLSCRNDIPENAWQLLKLFYDHGAIKYYDDKKINFADRNMRQFCQGFWLEDYTYLKLKHLDKIVHLQDFACSMEIIGDTGSKNEIDAAFLFNNTLYIVECKTARLDEKGADVLYKITTLKDFVGMLTRPVLVTFKHLKEHDRRRAQDLRITLIEGRALTNLDKHLINVLPGRTSEDKP